MTLTSGSVIQRSTLPLSAAVDGDIVMFHPDRGAYFTAAGEVGSRVWELVAQPISLEALCTTLTEEYDIEPARCRAEVETFVSQLHDAGLVELTD